jgi:hypothetical protein
MKVIINNKYCQRTQKVGDTINTQLIFGIRFFFRADQPTLQKCYNLGELLPTIGMTPPQTLTKTTTVKESK